MSHRGKSRLQPVQVHLDRLPCSWSGGSISKYGFPCPSTLEVLQIFEICFSVTNGKAPLAVVVAKWREQRDEVGGC